MLGLAWWWRHSASNLCEYVLRVTLLETKLQHSLVVSRSRFGDGAIPLLVPPFGVIVCSVLTGDVVDAPHPLRHAGVVHLPLKICDVLQQTGLERCVTI